VDRIKTSLTRLCKDLQETEFPNDVVQTQSLRSEHRTTRQEFTEDLESTVQHGEALRDCLADTSDDSSTAAAAATAAVRHRTELRQDRLEHVDAIDRSALVYCRAAESSNLMSSNLLKNFRTKSIRQILSWSHVIKSQYFVLFVSLSLCVRACIGTCVCLYVHCVR